MEYIVIKCPHCNDEIIIFLNELNCKIFRHGIYKSNYQQIDPHSSKEICDNLKSKDLIIGCGKPFQIVFNENIEKHEVIICDYI
jgi:DNA-directed RNA polymerase subunit RPC12/RpoP